MITNELNRAISIILVYLYDEGTLKNVPKRKTESILKIRFSTSPRFSSTLHLRPTFNTIRVSKETYTPSLHFHDDVQRYREKWQKRLDTRRDQG